MYNCTKAINYPMADNMSHLAISSGIAFILVICGINKQVAQYNTII